MTELFFKDRAPIVAIHGTASNGKAWRPLKVALDGQRDVLTPTLDGYGAVVPDALEQDRVDQLGALLHAQDQPVDLVGHSFGGAIALKIANIWPDRVRSVTLYDPVVPVLSGDGRSGLPADLDALWNNLGGASATTVMRCFLEYWGGENAWRSLPDENRDWLVANHPVAVRDTAEMRSGKWTVFRPRFHGPLNVFCGSDSARAAKQSFEQIAKTNPEAKCTKLPGLDHLAPLTNPKPVVEAIVNCLAEVEAASTLPSRFDARPAA